MGSVKHFNIAIVGAGTAGITIASRLLRMAPYLKEKIVLIDPSEKHYYQPLWTLVGGGAARKEDTERDQKDVIPEGALWLKERVTEFVPKENLIKCENTPGIKYDFLVVAAGLSINWDKIKGLKEAIGKNGVSSNYSYDYVGDTWKNIENFNGGTAIFTQPSTPIKCGGAPQKIMYLADDYFRKSGVRENTEIRFMSGTGVIFPVPRYANTLEKVVKRKQIKTNYLEELVEINGAEKKATFENLETKQKTTIRYDMIHVTPHMGPPAFISESPLADGDGWVDVDQYTLRHKKFRNVFGAGDCTNLPTSKTGAAIRKQAPTVAENLLALLENKDMKARYDGYTSCPLVTGYNRLVLAEFDYDKNEQESFPVDQSQERASMYFMKRSLLPIMYWNGMLKGTV